MTVWASIARAIPGICSSASAATLSCARWVLLLPASSGTGNPHPSERVRQVNVPTGVRDPYRDVTDQRPERAEIEFACHWLILAERPYRTPAVCLPEHRRCSSGHIWS